MQLVLEIKDLKVSTLNVRLKFILEGPGGRIESKDILPLASIHLVQGETTILSGPDLAPYLLNPNNLNFPNQQLRSFLF